MALNSLGMGFVFTATNLGRATFKGVQRDLTQTAAVSNAASARIATSMRNIKAGALLAGAGAIGLVGAFKLAGAAGEFERGIAGVGAITRATTEDLKLLEDAAIQAGIKTQFSPTEAVEGLTSLGQAGLSAKESITALQPTLDLAAGSLGQLGVADAAGLSVQAMKAFSIESKDVGFALDRMLRTTNSFNISAKELPLAFGIGARGALALNASLDDVAISLGLAKNVMPSVERASTSIAVGMERLARKTGQAKLASEFQVKAVDKATGKFRPFLDIMSDMIDKSKKMTDAQRSNALAQIFGARAGGGIQAILKQLTDGIKTNTGEVLKGREAIAFYRKEMQGAAGAAGEFSSALLDTFSGQKILLTGTLQTLAIVLGKPFARILKPVVKVITDSLNAVIRFMKLIPDPIQDALAAAFALFSALALGSGVVLLLKGVFGLLGVTLKGFISLIGSALLALWPLVLAVGVAVLAFKLFGIAWERNIGGIADIGREVFGKVKLFFQAMVQLFTQGGFSGAVMKDLNRASNKGLKAFVIDTFVALKSIQKFFGNLINEASKSFKFLEPAFEDFVDLLREVGKWFGFTAASAENNAASYDMMASAGVTAGKIVGDAIKGIAFVASTVFKGLSGLVKISRGELIDWGDMWKGLKRIIMDVAASIVRAFFKVDRELARAVDRAAGLIGIRTNFAEQSAAAEQKALSGLSKVLGVAAPAQIGEVEGGRTADLTSRVSRARGGSISAAESRNVTARFEAAQQAGFSEERMERLVRSIIAEQPQPVLEVDGEQLGEVTLRANRRSALRGFSEVPTGG